MKTKAIMRRTVVIGNKLVNEIVPSEMFSKEMLFLSVQQGWADGMPGRWTKVKKVCHEFAFDLACCNCKVCHRIQVRRETCLEFC